MGLPWGGVGSLVVLPPHDANSAAACAFIKRHHQEPFFFYCAYRAPHVPLDAPPKYLERFPGKMPERRRQALAMISAIDDGVGRMMSTLREYGLEEKTLIFLIGDNGAPLKIHKLDAPGGGANDRRVPDRAGAELRSLVICGRLAAEAALARQESRGAHYRSDSPEPREEWRRHLVFRGEPAAAVARGLR